MFDVVKTVWATGIWTPVRKRLSILLSCYSVSLNVYSVYLHYLRPAFTRRRAQVFKPIASVAAVTVSGATSKEPPKVSVPRVT